MEPGPEQVSRAAVAAALRRLEVEHCYGYPEFWDYLAEAEMSEEWEGEPRGKRPSSLMPPSGDKTGETDISNWNAAVAEAMGT